MVYALAPDGAKALRLSPLVTWRSGGGHESAFVFTGVEERGTRIRVVAAAPATEAVPLKEEWAIQANRVESRLSVRDWFDRSDATRRHAGAFLLDDVGLEGFANPDHALPGQAIGRFEVRHLIAEGSSGCVYLVADPLRQGEDRALKVPSPVVARDQKLRRRFLREQTLAGLQHPHLLPDVEVGEVPPPYELYLSMPVMPSSVGDRLRLAAVAGRPIRRAMVLRWIRELLGALTAVHAGGYVHRDVKPSNLLLDSNESLYLADFGIAHDASNPDGTRTGIGTSGYQAPELLLPRGRPTAATDVYAVGVVLAELLSLHGPTADGSVIDPEAVPVHPAPIAELISRMLARDPHRRATVPAVVDWLVEIEDLFDDGFDPDPIGGAAEVEQLRESLDASAAEGERLRADLEATRAELVAIRARDKENSVRVKALTRALGEMTSRIQRVERDHRSAASELAKATEAIGILTLEKELKASEADARRLDLDFALARIAQLDRASSPEPSLKVERSLVTAPRAPVVPAKPAQSSDWGAAVGCLVLVAFIGGMTWWFLAWMSPSPPNAEAPIEVSPTRGPPTTPEAADAANASADAPIGVALAASPTVAVTVKPTTPGVAGGARPWDDCATPFLPAADPGSVWLTSCAGQSAEASWRCHVVEDTHTGEGRELTVDACERKTGG